MRKLRSLLLRRPPAAAAGPAAPARATDHARRRPEPQSAPGLDGARAGADPDAEAEAEAGARTDERYRGQHAGAARAPPWLKGARFIRTHGIHSTAERLRLLETHWCEARRVAAGCDDATVLSSTPLRDHTESLMLLLVEEDNDLRGASRPCLDYVCGVGMFRAMADWADANRPIDIRREVFRAIIFLAHNMRMLALFSVPAILAAVRRMLAAALARPTYVSDGYLVGLVHAVCMALERPPILLDVFFDGGSHATGCGIGMMVAKEAATEAAEEGSDKREKSAMTASSPSPPPLSDRHAVDEAAGLDTFDLVRVLLEYVHSETAVGARARDALHLVVRLSNEWPALADHMVRCALMCDLLVAGLGGQYSRLPMSVGLYGDEWTGDEQLLSATTRELSSVITALQLCDGVVDEARGMIRDHLLAMLRTAFLDSVIQAAICQPGHEEAVAAMVYATNMLCAIRSPPLLSTFVQFLLGPTGDGAPLYAILIDRVGSECDSVAIHAMCMLRTLVDLNCEDIMLELALNRLLLGRHVEPSQRDAWLRVRSVHGGWVDGWLALASGVDFCSPDGSGFDAYLQHARIAVTECVAGCACWSSPYDRYHATLPVVSALAPSDCTSRSAVPPGGPLLPALLDRAERMLHQSPRLNLVLTDLLARLAAYPQPLLSAYLLDSRMPCRPGVRTLFRSLSAVVAEASAQRCASGRDFDARLAQARAAVEPAGRMSANRLASSAHGVDHAPVASDQERLLFGYVILEEFLKELAAIAAEQSAASWLPYLAAPDDNALAEAAVEAPVVGRANGSRRGRCSGSACDSGSSDCGIDQSGAHDGHGSAAAAADDGGPPTP